MGNSTNRSMLAKFTRERKVRATIASDITFQESLGRLAPKVDVRKLIEAGSDGVMVTRVETGARTAPKVTRKGNPHVNVKWHPPVRLVGRVG